MTDTLRVLDIIDEVVFSHIPADIMMRERGYDGVCIICVQVDYLP